MATNAAIIADALRLLGVLTETQTLSAEQGADGLVTLNDMLEEWSEHGIEVGYFVQTSPADDFPCGPTLHAPVKFNLAVHLAPQYGIAVRPDIGARAETYYRRLLTQAVYDRMPEQDMSHLPGGLRTFDIETG